MGNNRTVDEMSEQAARIRYEALRDFKELPYFSVTNEEYMALRAEMGKIYICEFDSMHITFFGMYLNVVGTPLYSR